MSYGLHTMAKRRMKEGVPYTPEHDTPTPPEAEWHSAEEDLRNSGARDVGGGGLEACPCPFFEHPGTVVLQSGHESYPRLFLVL